MDKIHNILQNSNNNERISWDAYFMSIATLASLRSPCNKLHVGSVIVKNNRIVSIGYNGFISGSPHISHIVDNHEQATVHSEINAITDCAKRGVCIDDTKIYVTHFPCINCFKAIVSSGIKKIIYYDDYNNNHLVFILAKDSNIVIQKYDSR